PRLESPHRLCGVTPEQGAVGPGERLLQRSRRDVLARVGEHLGEGVVGLLGPVGSEVLVGPAPEEQRLGCAHVFFGHTGDDGVPKGGRAAVVETAASILVRPARRLHNAVERQVFEDDHSAHRSPSLPSSRRSVALLARRARPIESSGLSIVWPRPERRTQPELRPLGLASTCSRGSQASVRGRYQLQLPRRFIVLGRTAGRMMVASIRRAAATPKPICWNMISSPLAKPAKTATMISAAPVMILAVEATPKVIASVVSPVWSWRSLIRLSRKTW